MAKPKVYVGVPDFMNPSGDCEVNRLTGVVARSPEEARKAIVGYLSGIYKTGTLGWSVNPIPIKSGGVSLEQTVAILSQLADFPKENLREYHISKRVS